MKLSQGGSIVGEPGAEAIVPMGLLTSLLHCRLSWSPKGVKLIHPTKGDTEVSLREGCPMVPAVKALDLIEEIEARKSGRLRKMEVEAEDWCGRKHGSTDW